MEWTQLILDFVTTIAWPITILIIVFALKAPIVMRLKHGFRFKGAGIEAILPPPFPGVTTDESPKMKSEMESVPPPPLDIR